MRKPIQSFISEIEKNLQTDGYDAGLYDGPYQILIEARDAGYSSEEMNAAMTEFAKLYADDDEMTDKIYDVWDMVVGWVSQQKYSVWGK